MNAVRRTLTTSAAALVAVASTLPLAGSAAACEIVVDSYTGSAQCLDLPQPTSSFSIAWLWIGFAAVLTTAVAVLVARRRPLKRRPAPTAPTAPKANVAISTRLHTTEQVQIPAPRTAEAEDGRRPVEPSHRPRSR
jgi:hypothetical protein